MERDKTLISDWTSAKSEDTEERKGLRPCLTTASQIQHWCPDGTNRLKIIKKTTYFGWKGSGFTVWHIFSISFVTKGRAVERGLAPDAGRRDCNEITRLRGAGIHSDFYGRCSVKTCDGFHAQSLILLKPFETEAAHEIMAEMGTVQFIFFKSELKLLRDSSFSCSKPLTGQD